MPVITVTVHIHAPIERCFDLARSIDVHMLSTGATQERAVAGVTQGLIGPGEEVTWEAVHFGIRQRLTSRITIFDPPYRFRDSMVRGAFARFDHDHIFEHRDGVTKMTDIFDYRAPWGILGRLADALFLERYMCDFLTRRAEFLRAAAESEGSQC